ncbi:MAG: hypothetical protein GWO20_08290, partial [Candidatus Korarchaeota archaeon]|nr:hypothetical protein [Candidatus Korarchaeota archaeon]
MKGKVLWFILSVVLGVVWSFLVVYFFGRIFGQGVYVLLLFVIVPLWFLVYDQLKKGEKIVRIVFLVVLVGSGSFLGSVRVGFVESMVLEDDSLIDVSNSLISLHVRNRGLSDIEILEVTVGEVSFNIEFRYYPLSLVIG